MTWREGSADQLSSRRACAKSRRRAQQTDPRVKLSPEWLLIEWPEGEAEPTKYWLSTLPENVSFAQLVDLAKLRWRSSATIRSSSRRSGSVTIEGRGWRGFHHHATLCIAAYGFLISEQETILPQDLVPPRQSRSLPYPTIIDPEDLPLRPERHVLNSTSAHRRGWLGLQQHTASSLLYAASIGNAEKS